MDAIDVGLSILSPRIAELVRQVGAAGAQLGKPLGKRAHMAQLRAKWKIWGDYVSLTIIESAYRAFIQPLLAYIDAIDRQRSDEKLVVVLPELVATRWWHHVLHDPAALRLKAALLFRPGTVVMNVPHYIGRTRGVRRRRLGREDIEAL